MMLLVPLVMALASDPSPAPSAAPPTPLKEIGRVRALPACTTIVVHANSAITTALDNDRGLAVMITNLKAIDFDNLNSLQRRNATETLMKQASDIRIASSAGDAEVKKLRAMADASTDPQRKAELKTFADALGGAIYRQKRAVVEFQRAITIVRGREETAEAQKLSGRDSNGVDTAFASRNPVNTIPAPPNVLPTPPVKYNDVMRQIAADLNDRESAVLVDEGVAADHSIAATSGC